MNRLREEPFFEQLLTDAQSEPDSVFFAAGSVFGGTGASGLPVVGRSLVDPIRGKGDHSTDIAGVPATRVSAALLLPYFTLPTPNRKDAEDGGPRPETALFVQNAIGALPTYVGRQAGFGSYYVIGDAEPREQSINAVGGEAQANAPHYVEFYSALAALDFVARGGEDRNSQLPAFYATAVERSNVSWADLPMTEESRRRLMAGFIAAHTFLTLFRPNGGSEVGLERRLKGVTWMETLGLRSKDIRDHSSAFDALGEYYARSWRWLTELRKSSPSLELVRADGRRPLEVGLQETIEGRRGVKNRKASRDGHEIFRYWNEASLGLAGKGYAGFLEVMRDGSELFAVDQFAETIKPAEHA
jgi:hypothetical protein